MIQQNLFPDQEEEKESSQPAIPVNLSPKQVSAEDRKTLATSGRTYLELYNKKDPMFAFSKMLVATFLLDLMKFSMTWKVKATQQGRLFCQLKRVVHRTEEIGSGSSQETWATPRSSPAMSQKITPKLAQRGKGNLEEQVAQKMFPTPTARDYKGARKPETLEKAGRTPTNSLPDMVAHQMFPTPTANEDAAGRPGTKMQKMLGNHPEVRNKGEGTLNADWVEWLMGYPNGWTSL